MMMKLLLFLLLTCCTLIGISQTDSVQIDLDSAEEMNVDSAIEQVIYPGFTQPVLRRISDDSLMEIKKQKSFAYMQYIDSFFRNKKLASKSFQKVEEPVKAPGFFSNPGLRMLYWLIAFAAVIWIMWRVFIGKSSLFTFNRKLEPASNEPVPEVPANIPIYQLVDSAIYDGNFRMATRYLYLQTLQLLAEKELISLAPQKTNYQYVQELNNGSQKPAFSKLTLRYEYAWFGNFKLSASQFKTIHTEFIAYHQAIAML